MGIEVQWVKQLLGLPACPIRGHGLSHSYSTFDSASCCCVKVADNFPYTSSCATRVGDSDGIPGALLLIGPAPAILAM